jgi:hypothetical protein
MLLLSENRSFRYQCISILEALVEGPLGFSGLEELLLQEPIVLDLDNLPARSLWYVAVWVYANEEFRLRLLKRIPGFQCSNEDHLKPLLGSTIDIGRIDQEVKNADDDNRLAFLRTIARIGNATMLEPFVQADVPLDEGNGLFNYLGAAAQFGNMDTFDLLLTAGANTAKAIPALCRYALRQDSPTVAPQLFSRLIDNLKPSDNRSFGTEDPFLDVIKNETALETRPDAPLALLQNNVFRPFRLHGSKDVSFDQSYLFHEILRDDVSTFEALLLHQVDLGTRIGAVFCDVFEQASEYTWVTLVVSLGRSKCVQAIVSHCTAPEAEISREDGAGRTAIGIAQAHVELHHPRLPLICFSTRSGDCLVSAADDAAILHML